MTQLPTYLSNTCEFPCSVPECGPAVKFRAETKRYFITIGHPAFNSAANNGSGYRFPGLARKAVAEAAARGAAVRS